MSSLDDFNKITRRNELLAPHTWLKVGGTADYLIEPRCEDELAAVIQCCRENGVPVRMLGGGSNVLVRDEGLRGVVLRLAGDEFRRVSIDGTTVRSGAAALLSEVMSKTVKAGLSGLEALAGIPGTIGGAIHGNAGGRAGDIGQFITQVRVMTAAGERFTRSREECSFSYRKSSVDELAIVECMLSLKEDDPDAITQRMRKVWVTKKATQPLSHQSAGCVFKNPRGLSAGDLIEQAGLKGHRVGGAEISDRHANFVVTDEGATTSNVLDLIDAAKSAVNEQFGVDLELEIRIW